MTRQTELGEYHSDFPSSMGPVTEYHGTIDMPSVLEQGIRGGNPRTRSKHYVPETLRDEERISYTTPDPELARQFALERAKKFGFPESNVGVVGVRAGELPEPVSQAEPSGGTFGGTESNVRSGGIPRRNIVPISTGEPMEIAFRLLKRELSPEAQRHKKEYDTEYESSPERVKYREELNRERRRRGIYGSGNHKDVSHTQGGKLTLEGEHANRARHFKNKGTLRVV